MYLRSTSTATVDNTSFIANTPHQWHVSDASSSINLTTCSPGTYFLSAQSHKGNVTSGGCPYQCPLGTYAGGTYHRPGLGGCDHPCLACPPGTFCNETGTGTPTSCPAGTYGDSHRLFVTACSGQCAPGYYCPAGSSVRIPASCSEGTFLSSGQAFASQADCNPCHVSTYCTGGRSAPKLCNAGSFANVTGLTVCHRCQAGRFSTEGLSACAAAGIGYWYTRRNGGAAEE